MSNASFFGPTAAELNFEKVQLVLSALLQPRPTEESDTSKKIINQADRYKLDFEDVSLQIYQWGEADKTILLVHGWESRASHWHHWINPLIDAGYAVTALDLPAHGESSGSTANVIISGRAVLKLSGAMGSFDSIIGHSMGSAACLYAFANGLSVRKSVHVAGPTSLGDVVQRAGQFAGLNSFELKLLLKEFQVSVDEPIENMEMVSLCNGLNHAGLLLHDPLDKEVPIANSRLLTDIWSKSHLVEVEGVGHRKIISDPLAIETAVNFLQND